jgi:hypothetical protein
VYILTITPMYASYTLDHVNGPLIISVENQGQYSGFYIHVFTFDNGCRGARLFITYMFIYAISI